MKLTVITCCWNSEPHIAQCIASVQAQQGVDLEHVFVDGGSTDGTLERIQALPGVASGRVRWVSGVGGGIARAMNAGVELARGDYIAHLHSDDYYLAPDSLARLLAVAEQARADWAFGRVVSDIDGQQIPNAWPMPAFSFKRLLRGNFVAHPALLMKRGLFQSLGGFRPELKFAMDYDLWLRAARVAPAAVSDDYFAAFRYHPGSTTTANRMKSFEEDHAVRLSHCDGPPWERLMHQARYFVRRRRLQQELALA